MADQHLWNLKFVHEVKKYPCLYNYKIPEYSRKDLTEKAWEDIGKVMNLAGHACKEKWRNLRVTYVRFLRNGTKHRPHYLTDAFKFLLPYLKNAEKLNLPIEFATSHTNDENTQEIEPENEPEDPVDEFSDYSDQDTTNKLKRKRTTETNANSVKTTVNFSPGPSYWLNDNPNKHFLMSILPELDEMNNIQIKKFKRRVLALIDDIMDEKKQQGIHNNYFSPSHDADLDVKTYS